MRNILLSAAALALVTGAPAASFAQDQSQPASADPAATQSHKAKKAKKAEADKTTPPANAADEGRSASTTTTTPSDAASNPPAEDKTAPATEDKPTEPAPR